MAAGIPGILKFSMESFKIMCGVVLGEVNKNVSADSAVINRSMAISGLFKNNQ